MRSLLIVMAVYFVPAAALITFAWLMEKWITRQLDGDSK